jgi:predicted AAA+ superfamily ATPase
MAFIPRLLATGRDHFFLLGPRGTGKTSWCAQQYPDALRIDLLNPAVLRRYSVEPEYLINIVEANTKARHIVIDEVQKLPTLLEVVHLLIERKAGQQFILTWGADDPTAVLDAYNALYLHEEVQAEGLVRNILASAEQIDSLTA